MKKSKEKPILITGAHRSGTTWIGRVVASAPGIEYIHEPFNFYNQGKGFKPDFWFQYVAPENEAPVIDYFRSLVIPQNPPALVGSSRRARRFPEYHPPKPRVLLKDPIAVFSAEWLASRIGMEVVVLIRHPAAFAVSIREKNWTCDFNHFLQQPLLMSDCLAPFREEIERIAATPHDILDEAALLWKMIYNRVRRYRQIRRNWLFLRHEDIAREPQRWFRAVFDHLHIRFSRTMQKTICDSSKEANPLDGGTESIHRNSRGLVKKWKNRLTPQEISRIRDGVGELATAYYSAWDW
jgi:hypothetical protein